MELDEFRAVARRVARRARRDARGPTTGPGTLDEQMAQLSKVKRLTFDAGWMRWGWPERVGGLGGSTLLRAYLGEALTSRDLVEPGIYSMTEVLAPTMIDYAAPELAAEMVPRLLRGDETWCQGFSEPGTGSNLAALVVPGHPHRRRLAGHRPEGVDEPGPVRPAVRAARPGRARRSRPTGASPRCSSTWTRPASPCDRSRPCTARHEFSEVFFDDVVVPFERTLGEEGQGWSVAMDLLPFERSTALWHRGRLPAPPPAAAARRGAARGARSRRAVGEVTQLLYAFRARLACHPASAGRGRAARAGDVDRQGPAGHAEQAVFDLAADGLAAEVMIGDDPDEPSGGGPSSSTRGRPRSTAAARRSSATSSPAGCSTSGRTADRTATTSSCSSGASRHATETHTGAALDAALGELGWHDALAVDRRAAVVDCCSSCRARPTPRRRRSTTSLAARARGRAAAAAVVLPRARRGGARRASSTASSRRDRSRPRRHWPRGRHRRRGRVGGRATRSRHRGHRRRSTLRPVAGPRPDARRCVEVTGEASTSPEPSRCRRRGPTPIALGQLALGARAGRRVTADARAGPRARRSTASSSAGRSRRSRPSAIGWPRRSSRSRRPTPSLAARVGRRLAADRGDGQGGRRAQRPHRGPPLPAGARRHRVHHRAPACTATSAGCSCSTSSSVRRRRSPAPRDRTPAHARQLPPLPPL